jgi:two-component system phosphate regulon sensor histidine kinase PhoR
MKHGFLSRLFPSYLLAVGASVAGSIVFVTGLISDLKLDMSKRALEAASRIAANALPADPSCAQEALGKLAAGTGLRFTLIGSEGQVLADTERSASEMENHGDRYEYILARREGSGGSVRQSPTLGLEMHYYGLALGGWGDGGSVLRAALPMRSLREELAALYLRIAALAALVLILVGLASWRFSRSLSQPLKRLEEEARRYASGDLSGRVSVGGPAEIASLSKSVNSMAEQLSARLAEISAQRNEVRAMLNGLDEAVLLLDRERRVVDANPAAIELFVSELERRPAAPSLRGRDFLDMARSSELGALLRRAESQAAPVDCELTLYRAKPLRIKAHARTIGSDEGISGLLVVISDITTLTRLESVRREFVANVSHELKTPITSIKGAVETLKAGAMEDRAEAERFVDMIQRQAARLEAIVEDLLSLARLEQEKMAIELEDAELGPLLESAAEALRGKAAERGMAIEVSCPEGLRARINPRLVEQALINLIDNAIKYSGSEAPLRVEAREAAGAIELSVRDEGRGIAAEHLERIFERFYVVDRARSRAMGGTGLGLAIVKHIALAHGGEARVESEEGRGSRFIIALPARPAH